jgi:outer membrane protein assembly factor BamB
MARACKAAKISPPAIFPIVWNGRTYVSTPHGGVLALDATTGKLLWQAPYNPADVPLLAVNRGVGRRIPAVVQHSAISQL